MMDELETNYDFKLKIFDQKFCKALVGTPIRFLITENRLIFFEKYGAGTRERGLELFFFKKIEVNYHSSSSCVF
jgi:hypothetical protein